MAKVMYNGKEVEAIDCTPTWESVLGIYLNVITNPKSGKEGKDAAIRELYRMAKLADEYNNIIKHIDETK